MSYILWYFSLQNELKKENFQKVHFSGFLNLTTLKGDQLDISIFIFEVAIFHFNHLFLSIFCFILDLTTTFLKIVFKIKTFFHTF
jgi:hypothetical protein